MELRYFKSEAIARGGYFDNSENAAKAWACSWGLDWWRNLWAYKEYTLGNLKYRTGTVYARHTKRSVVECSINDHLVSLCEFKKTLATFIPPAPTAAEKAHKRNYCDMVKEKIQKAEARRMKREGDPNQLTIDFVFEEAS